MLLEIMYIDDEQDLCDFFIDEYSSSEIGVRTFTDPKIAVESAKSNSPDLIFIDYRLPGARGDIIAQSFKSEIPKYLITGDINVVPQYQFSEILSKLDCWPHLHEILQDLLSKKSK